MSLHILAMIVAVAFAIPSHVNSEEFRAPSINLIQFTNYSDLAIEGYCKGISCWHGLNTIPPSKLEKSLGKEVSFLFRSKDAVAKYRNQRKLFRIFSLLQGVVKEKPDITFGPVGKLSFRKMIALHEFIQEHKEQRSGVFLTTTLSKGTSVDFFTHSVFAFDSEKEKNQIKIYFIDPNAPKKVQTFFYNIDNAKYSSTRDPKTTGHRLELLKASSAETQLDFYQRAIDSLIRNRSKGNLALAAFLGLEENKLSRFFQRELGQDTCLFDDWYHSYLKDSKSYKELPLPLQDYYFRNVPQAQLDLGCNALKSFVHRLLSTISTTADRSRSHFMNRKAIRRDTNTFPKIRVANEILWNIAQMATRSNRNAIDGKRLGKLPEHVNEELRCFENVLFSLVDGKDAPVAKISHAWVDVLWWRWFDKRFSAKSLNDREKAAYEILLKRTAVSRTLSLARVLSNQADKTKEQRALNILRQLIRIQQQASNEWRQELKNGAGKELPDYLAHRSTWLWNGLQEAARSLNNTWGTLEFRKLLQKWLNTWLTFLQNHNLNNRDFWEKENILVDSYAKDTLKHSPVQYLKDNYPKAFEDQRNKSR